jgi:hypothetical protein
MVDPNDPTIIDVELPGMTNGRYTVAYRAVGRDGSVLEGGYHFSVAAPPSPPAASDEEGPIAWPPVRVQMEASYAGSLVTYRMFVLNLTLRELNPLTIQGGIPAGARYVSSYLVVPGANSGRSDGITVGWTLLQPIGPIPFGDSQTDRRRFGPFVFVVDTTGLAPGTDLRSNAWAQWIIGALDDDPDDDTDEGAIDQIGGESASAPVQLVIGPNGLPTRLR